MSRHWKRCRFTAALLAGLAASTSRAQAPDAEKNVLLRQLRQTLHFMEDQARNGLAPDLAQDFFDDAIGDLAVRDYARADLDFQRAMRIDPDVGGAEWKRKAGRLKELVSGMELEDDSSESEELRARTAAAGLANQAILARLDGRNADALLLAHVAAGAGERDGAFMNLLEVMARVTRQTVVRDDILPASAFEKARLARVAADLLARRYARAVQSCKEILVVAPERAPAWTCLGSAYFAAGEKTLALEAYRKALDYAPADSKLRSFAQALQPPAREAP